MATLYESPLKRSHFETELEDFDPAPKRVFGAYAEQEEIIFPSNWAQAFSPPQEPVIPRDGKKRSSYFEDYSRAKRLLTDETRHAVVEQENENNPYIFTPNMKRLHQSFEDEGHSLFDPHKRQRPEHFQPTQTIANPWHAYNTTPATPPNSPNQYALVPVKKPFRNFQLAQDYVSYPPLPRHLHVELPQEYLQLTVWEPPSLENGRLFELQPTEDQTDRMDWS